jgi:hypothetical protein
MGQRVDHLAPPESEQNRINVVIFAGTVGAGKTTLIHRLAKLYGIDYIRADDPNRVYLATDEQLRDRYAAVGRGGTPDPDAVMEFERSLINLRVILIQEDRKKEPMLHKLNFMLVDGGLVHSLAYMYEAYSRGFLTEDQLKELTSFCVDKFKDLHANDIVHIIHPTLPIKQCRQRIESRLKDEPNRSYELEYPDEKLQALTEGVRYAAIQLAQAGVSIEYRELDMEDIPHHEDSTYLPSALMQLEAIPFLRPPNI